MAKLEMVVVWYLPSWIPFNSIRRTAERGRQRVSDIVHGPIKQVKQDMQKGAYLASFVSDFLEHGSDESQAIREQLPWVAWSMFEGAFLLHQLRRGV
jgi:hypothetical protein